MEDQNSRLSRKRRTWRKLHLGVNVCAAFRRKATGEIVTAVVTTNNVSDDQVFSDLRSGSRK